LPRIDPAEFESLQLRAFPLLEGFPLHDVWRVDLEGDVECTIEGLRALVEPGGLRSVHPAVRALFAVRSFLGAVLRLDRPKARPVAHDLVGALPARLVRDSQVPPGTPEGAFLTLYRLPTEAAYEVRNATVHAVLVVAIVRSDPGHRFFFSTYVKPVGRITGWYMRLIDPFRRAVVYPGLEAWLVRAWRAARAEAAARAGIGSDRVRSAP
jgi:hypothetical protein